MRKTTYIAIFCLFALRTSAQFNFEFHSGYGSYSNSDLKKYQSTLLSGLLPGGKILESFPAFWYYGVDAKWDLPNSLFGLSLSQGSSGGQVYYADYSGAYKDEQLLKYKAVRILTAGKFTFNKGTTSIQIDPRFGLAFATLQGTQSITTAFGIQPFGTSQSSTFKAVNPFFEPTFSLSQKLRTVSINIFVGYQVNLATNRYRQSNGRPMTFNGTEATMNLSGLRTGGSIAFYLGRAKVIDFTRTYLGLGVGIDFGGIGLNAMSMLTEHFGLFGALGYNLDNIGMNGGLRLYANDQSARWRHFISAMYGYNAVFLIKDAENFNKTFYGTTIGVGLDLKDSNSNFWTLALQVPIRSDDVKAYKTYLKSSNIEIERDLLPISISLGYRIAVKK